MQDGYEEIQTYGAELIAIILRTGLHGHNAVAIAQQLLREYKDLNALAQASIEELQKVKGIGRDKAVTLKAAFTLARRMAQEIRVTRPQLDDPEAIANHVREVFRKAIVANASALVLVHNHPSGDPTPSKADITVTRDLIRAGELLKLEILDHIILGQKTTDRARDYVSLKEMGYFYQ